MKRTSALCVVACQAAPASGDDATPESENRNGIDWPPSACVTAGTSAAGDWKPLQR